VEFELVTFELKALLFHHLHLVLTERSKQRTQNLADLPGVSGERDKFLGCNQSHRRRDAEILRRSVSAKRGRPGAELPLP